MSRSSEFLFAQFNVRKSKNPRYSQRAFAKLIALNPGRVTQYFRDERPITKNAAKSIAAKLGLDEEQTSYFIYLTEVDRQSANQEPERILGDDELAMVVEWYHFAVLSLISTHDFRYDVEWMSQRLNLPDFIVQSSLDRLKRLGLIEDKDGELIVRKGPIATQTDVPNEFLRLSHQDTLRYVIDNVAKVPPKERDLSSITLAIDSKKVEEAKKMIRVFRRKLAGFLSSGKKDEVYTINVQLFPFTKGKN